VSIFPTFAGLESEGVEEAVELVKRVGRRDGADKRDSLNHRFDCIVWEYGTRLLLWLAGFALPRGDACELRDAAV
jgi:hypothetical protein